MTMQYVQPTDEQKATMQTFRDKYEALGNDLATLPPSRGLSLAFTALEESAMWVNKAITQNDKPLSVQPNSASA
jgi:hypothetical protein